MELIYHTAELNKDVRELENLFNSGLETIELDFVLTRDGVPIWTHDIFPTQLLKSTNKKLNNTLSLHDVLEINNHRAKLMLDIKCIQPNLLNSNKLNKLLNMLNQYDEMQIQSLDLNFLSKLVEGNYSNIEKGLIVNVITRNLIDLFRLSKIGNLDFLALS